MPNFSYRVIDSDGKERKGSMNAPGKEQIEKKLTSEGLIIVDVDKEDLLDDGSLFGRGKVDLHDFAMFTRQLSQFLKAGIGVINSLRMMEEQIENSKMKNTVAYLAEQISEGDSLSLSMQNSDIFPESLVAVVESGEDNGRLTEYLENMTVYFEKCEARDNMIKKAICYPFMCMLMVLIATVSVIIFVVPSFMDMLEGLDIRLPLSTRIIVGISTFLGRRWWFFLILVALIVLIYEFIVRSRAGRNFASKMRIKFPGLLKYKLLNDCAKFTRIMSVLLKADIPLIRALEISGNQFIKHVLFKKGIIKVKTEIASGGSLSNSLEKSGVFPKLLVNMLSIGEESGSIIGMFENAAEYYENQFEDAVRKSSAIVEFVLIALMIVVLGAVIMSLLKPLLILFETVGSM